MCIELHKPSAESVNAHLACEQDEKFVPSQFERGSPAEQLESYMQRHVEAMDKALNVIKMKDERIEAYLTVLREIVEQFLVRAEMVNRFQSMDSKLIAIDVTLLKRAQELVQP